MRSLPLLTHYSREPLTAIQSRGQRPEPNDKPRGLWVSVDEGGEGWKDWCEVEGYRLHRLACVHDVMLASDVRILHLSNVDDIDVFTAAYHAPIAPGIASRLINWSAVADKYQGIIIAPYIWERRVDDLTFWYRGWDCASGCLWDAAAIESIRLRADDTAESV